jgi:hypothetical protein
VGPNLVRNHQCCAVARRRFIAKARKSEEHEALLIKGFATFVDLRGFVRDRCETAVIAAVSAPEADVAVFGGGVLGCVRHNVDLCVVVVLEDQIASLVPELDTVGVERD